MAVRKQKFVARNVFIVREPPQEIEDTPLEFFAASEKLANVRKRESQGRTENLSALLQHSLEVLSHNEPK